MKKILQLLFVVGILVNTNYAQEKKVVTVDEYISFIKKAETVYLIKENYGFSAKENYSKEEIKDIKRNIFLANRNGIPKLSKEIFTKEIKEIQKKWKGNREEYGKHFSQSKRKVTNNLIEILKKNIPTLEYKLIANEIIIKGVILKRTNAYRSIDETKFKMHVNYFDVEIEDIIIGDKILKTKDVINVYFLSEWTTESGMYFCSDSTGTFIFRLRDNGISSKTDPRTRYAIISDSFSFEDNNVLDANEYFESGKIIEWNKLKENLNNTINNIVN